MPNCKKCGWDYSKEPTYSQTAIDAHTKQLCSQCFAQTKMSKDADKRFFESFFFSKP